MIDTEMTPHIMAPIKQVIEDKFQRKDWIYVINTHAHMHHAGGNCLFKDAQIVGHDNLAADMQWIIDIQKDQQEKQQRLERLDRMLEDYKSQIAQARQNKRRAPRLQGAMRFYELLRRDVEAGFEVVKPGITFSDQYTLDLGDLQLELVYFGKGHSLSDILIYIPQEGVLVTGAVCYRRLPRIYDKSELKDVQRYIDVLGSFLADDITIKHLVPSHSHLLTRNDLKHVHDYYQTMLQGIRRSQQMGQTLEQAQENFTVKKKFRFFYQKNEAQEIRERQEHNIELLYKFLEQENRPAQAAGPNDV
jgi:glyoxylase-like metal-dependent hydrolase (beta-lactamase superfamily II)